MLAEDRRKVASLIDDFGRVSAGLATRGEALRSLARDARHVSEAVAARDKRLVATLRAMPPFIDQATGTLRRLGAFSSEATPVLADLRVASDRLAPAMRQLVPASRETRGAVRSLGRFAPRGRELLDSLRTFAPVGRGLMDPLESVMREMKPGLAYMAPYAKLIGGAISNTAGVTGVYDATGHLIRSVELYNGDSVGYLDAEQRAAVNALTRSGHLQPLTGTTGYNPYPPPGDKVKLEPFKGSYPRITADPPYKRR